MQCLHEIKCSTSIHCIVRQFPKEDIVGSLPKKIKDQLQSKQSASRAPPLLSPCESAALRCLWRGAALEACRFERFGRFALVLPHGWETHFTLLDSKHFPSMAMAAPAAAAAMRGMRQLSYSTSNISFNELLDGRFKQLQGTASASVLSVLGRMCHMYSTVQYSITSVLKC